MADGQPRDRRGGPVRSIERVFLILETLAESGGTQSLSQLAEFADIPLPTIHRLLRTLVELGYVRQDESRKYILGARLLSLADQGTAMLSTLGSPYLSDLVDRLGESANLAMLDGTRVVYVCHIPSRHSMRMFTDVGNRVDVHCTAVGKVLMSSLGEDEMRSWLKRSGMPPRTERTITDPDEFIAVAVRAAADGFAVDDGEQEIGVRCLAVPVTGTRPPLALSVSGPAARMDPAAVERAIPELQATARLIAEELREEPPRPSRAVVRTG